jgi:hypothetical protein
MVGKAWVVALAALAPLGAACGSSAGPPSAAFDGSARQVPCSEKVAHTRCFDVEVENRGSVAGSGECWVAAIANYRAELGKSDYVSLDNVEPDDSRQDTVSLTLTARDWKRSPTFPVHCDPGPEG